MKIFVFRKAFLLAFSLGLAYSSAAQDTLFVRASALPNGNGHTWATAFSDLQTALALAQSGDAIWVADGVYKPDTATDRNRTFLLPSGVRLIGGFKGNETSVHQRDSVFETTILSGDIGQPDDSLDNSRTVLMLVNPDATTLVDGFVIEKGRAFSDSIATVGSPLNNGGGIYIDGSFGIARPRFQNCTIRNCTAITSGGGVYVKGLNTVGTSPSFWDCRFLNNQATNAGGIWLEGGDTFEHSIDFLRCHFEGNTALKLYGSLYYAKNNGSDTLQIIDSKFIRNTTRTYAAAISAFDRPGCQNFNLKINKCEFSENKRTTFSNGTQYQVQLHGESFNSSQSSFLDFSNNSINDSIFGISTEFYEAPQKQSIFNGNSIFNYSVVRFSWDGYDVIEFKKNQIKSKKINQGSIGIFSVNRFDAFVSNNFLQGGISLRSKDTIDTSRFLVCNNIAPRILFYGNPEIYILNNLFIDGLFSSKKLNDPSLYFDKPRKYVLENNIYHNFYLAPIDPQQPQVWSMINNSEPQYFRIRNNILPFSYSIFDPKYRDTLTTITTTDLNFVNEMERDFHLLSCSPAVQSGVNSTLDTLGVFQDFDGGPRIQDGIVDIGPFESPQLIATLQALGPACHQNSSGKIQFSLANGCLPAQLSWSKSDGQIGSDSLGLSAGVYVVTLTDGRGKTISDTLQILGSSPAVEVSGDSINCFGLSPAELFSTASGGADPLVFLWNTGQNGSKIDGLGGGTYILTVTDALGCTAVDSAKVIETPMLGTSLAIVEASWAGGSNGAASVDVFAGLTPFSLLWSTGDTSKTIAGLAPGDYFLTVTDSVGCEEIYPFSISFGTSTRGDFSETNIRFSPNPASDFAQIELLSGSFSDRTELRFSNVLGKTIFQTNFSAGRATVRTTDWPAGLYFAQLFENGIPEKTGKLIVVKN